MPTITTALAESLFQYNTNESLAKGREAVAESSVPVETMKPSMRRLYYSPALYATPPLAPIPDVSSIAGSPTTYVVNHKRRGARPCPAVASRVDQFEIQPKVDVLNEVDVTASSESFGGGKVEEKFLGEDGDVEAINDGVMDNFLEPLVSINVDTSGSDIEDGGSVLRSRLGNQLSSSRNRDEYYDTAEEFFSDGSFSNSSPSFRSTEKELHILRVAIVEEFRRRELAEKELLYLNKLYGKLLKCLSYSSSSLFELPNIGCLNRDIDPTELCQEIIVLKFVSETLQKDLAKDEYAVLFDGIIASKDHEISRLRERMRYYEAMNREMSQRNQETVDLARKQRLRRRRMRRWTWRCVGLSIAAGAALLAYSYLPHHHHHDFSSSASSSESSTAGTE